MSLHHHPAQCERRSGESPLESAHNLSHACWNRALVRVVGRPVSVTLGGPGRPTRSWQRAVVSPMRGVAPACCLAGACRPIRGRATGRRGRGGRSGHPFAVLPPPPRPCDARSERWCRPPARRGGGAVLPLAVAVSRGLRERGSKGTAVSPYRATAEPVPGGAAGEGRPGNRRAVARGCRPGPAGPVPGAGCRVPSAGCRVPGAGCWVPGAGCGCRVPRASCRAGRS